MQSKGIGSETLENQANDTVVAQALPQQEENLKRNKLRSITLWIQTQQTVNKSIINALKFFETNSLEFIKCEKIKK